MMHAKPRSFRAKQLSAVVALVLCIAFVGSAIASAPAAAATGDPIVGDWRVTYGNTTVVAISSAGGTYTVTATEPLQVTGSSCYLAPGTVIATFSGSGSSYSGQGGLWNMSNCSFLEWTSLEITPEGNTLTAKYGSGCASSPSCAKAVFTRVTPLPAPSPPAPAPTVTITSGPPHETAATSGTFTFAGVAGGAYECSVDAGSWAPCTSGKVVGPLLPGDHLFQVRETLGGLTSATASYRWTIALPKACVLRVARARVFAYTKRRQVRLVIRYTSYRPADVTVSYRLVGANGKSTLGSASAHFSKAGVFRLPESLSANLVGKVSAARLFEVRFKIPKTPQSCGRYYTKQLTIPQKISGQTVWFQSDSTFAP